MDRSNLKLWLGVGAFVALVTALSLIAINRDPGPTLHGHWTLSQIETPEGTYEGEGGVAWIEFDDGTFRGKMDCLEFEGTMTVAGAGSVLFDEWSSGGPCNEFDDIDFAFDQYFHLLSEYEFTEGGLTLESPDASVQFVYVSEGA